MNNPVTTPGHKALRYGRFSEAHRFYLITTATYKRNPIFTDWQVGRLVVKEMHYLTENENCAESKVWVLMPNHLHWLFALTGEKSLSEFIQLLKGRAAHRINRYLGRKGTVWDKAFHDHALRNDEDIINIARYIVANPIRAGLVRDIAEYPLWDSIWLEG